MTTTARYALIVAAVGVADLATKQLLVTPDGLEHHVGRSYIAVALTIALVNWTVGARLRIYWPTGLVAAGCLCNAIDALDGSAQNPLIVVTGINELGTNAVAFNAADIALALGITLAVARFITLAARRVNSSEVLQK